jgi:hypothetical protein
MCLIRNPSPVLIGIGIPNRIGFKKQAYIYIDQFTTSQHNSYLSSQLHNLCCRRRRRRRRVCSGQGWYPYEFI